MNVAHCSAMKKCAAIWCLLLVSLAVKASAADKPYVLSIPNKTGALSLQLRGFKVTEYALRPDGSGARIAAKDENTHMFLTAFVETAPRSGSALDCRTEW